MLTTSKPRSAGQRRTRRKLTAKEQNYWSQQGVIAGGWQGRLARRFGLGAFIHALPPSFGLRSVPSPASRCFSSLPLQ